MKTGKIALIILIFLLFFVACAAVGKISCRITYGDLTLLQKDYPVDLITSLRFQKDGDMRKSYEKSGKSPSAFLRSVHEDMLFDVKKCCHAVFIEKTEPSFSYLGDGRFSFAEGKMGRYASEEETALRLIKSGGCFSMPVRPLSPVLTVDDLKKHTEKITAFSCEYASSSENRKHNIALAAEKLDNLTVEGGEELSFNKAVGERTKENGFTEAGVILNGSFTQGVGGGVCQVSTTLYNAWIRAGLSARSRNHSLAVSYVPPGTDAMVSSSSDLVLENDGPCPVFLDSHCDGNTVSFTLYGTKQDTEVRIWSEKLATFPCDEYEVSYGDEEKILSFPTEGSLYQSYRDFSRNGKLLRREKLRQSKYKTVKGKKIVKKEELPE